MAGAPYEVELKARLEDRAACEQRLTELGGRAIRQIVQQDEYFNHPCRDFAQTDEALRIRQFGEQFRVTYKGPKLAGPTKTRKEIEFSLPANSAADCRHCLIELGFRPVAVVTKTRSIWHVRYASVEFEVALDEVDRVGSFIELEVRHPGIALDKAQKTAEQLARRLKLGSPITTSYLEMVLETIGGETSS